MNIAQKTQATGPGGRDRKPGATGAPVLLETVPLPALLQACRRLQSFWNLDAGEMAGLMGTSRSTWFRWLESHKAGKPMTWTDDNRVRALALLRIYEAVADLHHEDRDAAGWIHEPLEAPGFNGRSPLAVMRSGIEGLLEVRDYLNFLHGAWS